MWRSVTAAILLTALSGCSPRASAPPVRMATADATPLDDLVKTIAGDETAAAKSCLGGKASACKDRDYAIRSLNERGYCRDTPQSAWAKCQPPAPVEDGLSKAR